MNAIPTPTRSRYLPYRIKIEWEPAFITNKKRNRKKVFFASFHASNSIKNGW